MHGSRLFCIIQDSNGEAVVVVPSNSRPLSMENEACRYHISVQFPVLWLKPGVYSVFFKLLGDAVGAGQARFISDSVMLDVSGDSDPETLLGRLAPAAAWAVDRVSTSLESRTPARERALAVDASVRAE